jgi:cysteine desulfurase
VAACVGLAAAVRLTARDLIDANERVVGLQRKLCAALSLLPSCAVTAPAARKVPGTVHVTFEGIASDELLFLLDQQGVCASAASSCSSGAALTSHVLAAMGVSYERARGSLRLSMGPETTEDEIDRLIVILSAVVYGLNGEA